MSKLLLAFLLFFVGQTMIWIQTNGQFVWEWFKKNPLLVSIIMGTSISYVLIYATKLIVEYYDGLLWPGRFIGFSVGMLQYALFVNYYFSEGMNLKTYVSLSLCFILIL